MSRPSRSKPKHRRPATSRPGFIIFFGYRTLTRDDGREAIETTCPACRQSAWMHGKCQQPWFTLFFVPVFPLKPRGSSTRFSQCGDCGQAFGVPIEEFARRVPGATVNDHASAIRIYNELREHPSDSARMLKLLRIYDAMDELREAESSARAFPAAFSANADCAEVLERLRQRTAASDAVRPAAGVS